MEKTIVSVPSSSLSNQPTPEDRCVELSEANISVDPSINQPLAEVPFERGGEGKNINPLPNFCNKSKEFNSIYGGVAVGIQQTAPRQAISQPPANTNWSTSLQTVLDQPPSTLPRQLILGGIVFCLAFGAWASFGKIDEVGHAPGRLVFKGDVYKIHPVASGKVADMHVKEGDEVNANQVLLALDPEIAANEVERLKKEHAGYQTQLLQTQDLIDQTRLEAQNRTAIMAAQKRVQEGAIAQAKAQAQAQEVGIAQNQVNIETQRELLTELQTDATAHEERLKRLKPLIEAGALSSELVFQGEQALRERQRTITQTQGEIQQSVSESERLKAERQKALAELDRLQAELIQKQAEGTTTQLESQQKIQQLEVQKTQLKAQIDDTENLLAKAQTQLKELSLTTPVDGVVLSLNIHNIGEVVQPGQTIAEIAPQGAPLVLSAILPNQEAGFVKTGMPVQVKLDAYPYQDYGIVTGKVSSISPDTKPDERLGAVYHVEVALDRSHITAHNQTIQLKAGQTATAEIIIRRRRIVDILLDPIRQLQKGGISL
ncbi:MAG TPA: secretion protein HlyD [Cyanobacteria bacterium UBA11162]|nr:secretion protein HlyD [Cyanobacteria bacterium UBA11162]